MGERESMIDPHRKRRVHVVGVHGKDGKFFVDLSDDSWITWNAWIVRGGRLQIGGPPYPSPHSSVSQDLVRHQRETLAARLVGRPRQSEFSDLGIPVLDEDPRQEPE